MRTINILSIGQPLAQCVLNASSVHPSVVRVFVFVCVCVRIMIVVDERDEVNPLYTSFTTYAPYISDSLRNGLSVYMTFW